MDLIINTDNGPLKLFPGQDYHITRQLFDITSLNHRKGDFAKILSIPNTLSNLTILEVSDTKLQTGVNGSLSVDGLMVVSNASIFYGIISKATIEIELKLNNSDLFDKIDKNLSELDLAAYDFTLDQSGANGIKANTTGVVYPLCDWLDEKSSILFSGGAFIDYNLSNDVNITGFFMYCKTIIEEIISQAGFELTTDIDDSNYDTIAVACPVTDFLRIEAPDIFAIVDKASGPLAAQSITGGAALVDMVVNVDAGALWSAANDEYTIVANKDIELIAVVKTFFIAGSGIQAPKVRIIENGITIAEYTADGGKFQNETLRIQRITSGVSTYSVQGFADGTDVLWIQECELTVNTTGANPTDDIIVSERMPDMLQKDFLSNILRQFNLLLDTNSNTGLVTISSFDNVYTDAEQDLSALLVDNLDQSSLDESPYFRNNAFKYNGDDLNSISSHTEELDDTRLVNDGDVIVLDFIAGLTSEIFRVQPTSLVGAYEVDFVGPERDLFTNGTNTFLFTDNHSLKIGDWISVGSDTKRIVTLSSALAGTVASNWTVATGTSTFYILKYSDNDIGPTVVNILASTETINITDGNWQDNATTMANLRAYFDENLSFTGLVLANYSNLMESLNSYKMLEAHLMLDVFQFNNLDIKRPLFLQQYNAHFFISAIEQWSPDRPTRVQLFRL